MGQKLWISVGMTLFLALLSYLYIDQKVAYFFHDTALPNLRAFFGFLTTYGKSEYYLVPGILLYLLYRKKNEQIRKASLLLFGSVAISGIGINIIKVIVARYRPPMLFKEHLYGFEWFDVGYLVNSFPSGHSATALSAFIAFALVWPKFRWLFVTLGVMIAASRIVLTVHYVSDVMVGGLIGALTSYVLYHKIYKGKYENRS